MDGKLQIIADNCGSGPRNVLPGMPAIAGVVSERLIEDYTGG
jgi:hypothetical protein